MPYIPQNRREEVAHTGEYQTPGELNYEISFLLNEYIKQHGLSYSTINDIVGALEGAKLEFYRRVAAPYEEKKIKDNGDVYDVD